MPHVIVKMKVGRTEEQKRRLTEEITKDLIAICNVAETSVSIAIEEFPRDEWDAAVYEADIVPNWEKLYKEPGYGRRP
jgi:4-oxalocrotonate tautomerase